MSIETTEIRTNSAFKKKESGDGMANSIRSNRKRFHKIQRLENSRNPEDHSHKLLQELVAGRIDLATISHYDYAASSRARKTEKVIDFQTYERRVKLIQQNGAEICNDESELPQNGVVYQLNGST